MNSNYRNSQSSNSPDASVLSDKTHKENEMLDPLIRDRVSPGGVLLASRYGRVVFNEAMGTTAYSDPESSPVVPDTVYDIASITKVVTATGLMILLDRGEVSLQDQLGRFFSQCSYGNTVTLWHLLTHTSGIAVQMSQLVKMPPEEIQKAVLRAPLSHTPGQRVLFTNVNSYLAGRVIEHVAVASLDRFLKRELLQPLGMLQTSFNPPSTWKVHIAPTEISAERGVIWGEVHDSSAHALGGIAGHAGLFSTAQDLHSFCELWLNGGDYNGLRFFGDNVYHEAIRNHAPPGSLGVGLGWMLQRSWMGPVASTAFGHTAFTGPSTMINPDNGLIVILLTNRTYPRSSDVDRHVYNAKIIEVLVDRIKRSDG